MTELQEATRAYAMAMLPELRKAGAAFRALSIALRRAYDVPDFRPQYHDQPRGVATALRRRDRRAARRARRTK